MMRSITLLAWQGDGGVFLPEDAGSAIVWVLFIGVIAGLYVLVSRTRRRHEQEFWQRKREEEERRRSLGEPEDPSV